MSDTPKTDAMMEAIEVEEIKLIAGGNQATYSSDAMESITELARDFERENAELRQQLEQANIACEYWRLLAENKNASVSS